MATAGAGDARPKHVSAALIKVSQQTKLFVVGCESEELRRSDAPLIHTCSMKTAVALQDVIWPFGAVELATGHIATWPPARLQNVLARFRSLLRDVRAGSASRTV